MILSVLFFLNVVGSFVCFSPSEDCSREIMEFLDSAKESVDVAIFDFNLEGMKNHLVEKARKMRVRMVVDKRQSKGPHSLVGALFIEKEKNPSLRLEIRYGRQKGIMHDKFMIVDGKRMETGSFNYTAHATYANHENQIYLDDREIVLAYSREFEKIWSSGLTFH